MPLPRLEQVKADEKTKLFLDAYQTQKMKTDVSVCYCGRSTYIDGIFQADEEAIRQAKRRVDELLGHIHKTSEDAASNGLLDKEKYVIPPHLHDLQEADLPETQRGLVMTEIAQFRERAAKREREKMRDVQAAVPAILGPPSGPKQREWGKPAATSPSQQTTQQPQGFGKGAQGFSKPVGFVPAEQQGGFEDRPSAVKSAKSDEELEAERKEARRRDEENSFRDVSDYVAPSCSCLIMSVCFPS